MLHHYTVNDFAWICGMSHDTLWLIFSAAKFMQLINEKYHLNDFQVKVVVLLLCLPFQSIFFSYIAKTSSIHSHEKVSSVDHIRYALSINSCLASNAVVVVFILVGWSGCVISSKLILSEGAGVSPGSPHSCLTARRLVWRMFFIC